MRGQDFEDSSAEVELASSFHQRSGPDDTDMELLWRVRCETTLNFCRGMQRDMMVEEDAARRQAQRAYFAGAARAWELAAQRIEDLLRL